MSCAHIGRYLTSAMAAAGCLWLAGCAASREPQYYLLAGAFPAADGPVSSPAPAKTVYLLPVRMPAYLDRPQIVTRPSPWEIKTSEFHRWGMPLDGAVADLLTAVLGRELPGAAVAVAPPPGLASNRPGACLVQLEIDSLDGVLGGEIILAARWTILAADGGAAPRKELRRAAQFRRPVAGPEYADYAQAISAAVDELGRSLAASLREF